jgi:uncharacterized protein YjiS (DUF1127 family)
MKATRMNKLFGPVRSLFNNLGERRRRAAAIREFERMPGWRLADLGIEPAHIPQVVDAMLAVQPSPMPPLRLVEAPAMVRQAVIRSELKERAA